MKNYSRFLFLFLALLFPSGISFAQSIGLVLSGGGVRGLAHIGVLKALEENHIPIDYITGTSAGALVGSMYASGLTPEQIEKIVTTTDFVRRASGQFDEDNLYYFKKPSDNASWINIKLLVDTSIRMQLPSNVVNPAEIDFSLMQSMAAPIAVSKYDFDSLMVPFRCVAADITAKQPVVFSNGDLALAVRASMAFPFYYPPVLIGNNILYDGGIYNNFPCDIMLKEFNPDIIIGVSAAGLPEVPVEGNFLSQLRTMITHTTNYTVPRPQDFLIEPDVRNINSLDFDQGEIKNVIDSGYNATIRNIALLKLAIHREADMEELKHKRIKIQNSSFNITVDRIFVYGADEKQADYIRAILNPKNQCISLLQLKTAWFKLVADDNLRYAFPRLMFNSESGNYDLHIDVKRNKGIFLDFGGVISSRPINTGFVGIQHNFWGRHSLKAAGNIYFGKFYNSGQARLRLDVPGTLPLYVEPSVTLNQWDYYKSSTALIADVKPSFLVQYDRNYGLALGFPARNKGKIIVGGNDFLLRDRYYLDRDFSESDTADQTKFSGLSASLEFERSTLNRKQYANQGTYFDIGMRFVSGDENTSFGSSGISKDPINKEHSWFQLRVQYDNYFTQLGKLRIGLFTELMFSNQDFFATYTASVSSAPAFQPLQDMKTRFLEAYSSYNYTAFGLKNVFSINSNFDIRLEAYIFQPFQEILPNDDYTAHFGDAFNKRYFLGSLNPVYYSPIGPISLSLNYYYKDEKPVVLMFQLGYILFNRKALN